LIIKLHRALAMSGNAKSADQRLSLWLKQNPNDIAVRSYAAEYYLSTNQNHAAITEYEELLRLAPQSAVVLNNLANLYLREKDSRALTTAEQALKLAPDQPTVQDTLGWVLLNQGQLPRGLDLLRKAASKAPKSSTFRYHYAVALVRNGNKADARKELDAAIALKQKFPELEEAKALLKSL
jgi:Flp pilus assembly protein TadD